LNAKVKALHEISRLIWLELRSNKQANNDRPDAMEMYREHLKRMTQQAEEARSQREAASALTDKR
jgi:hypothetical protein